MVSWEQLMLVKNAVFYWKDEWEHGWNAHSAQGGLWQKIRWRSGKLCSCTGTGSRSVLVGPGLGAQTDPQGHSPEGGLWPLPLGFALRAAGGTSPGHPPTRPCWWHLPACGGVSSIAGEMRCPPPARQTASCELFARQQVWRTLTLRKAFYIIN